MTLCLTWSKVRTHFALFGALIAARQRGHEGVSGVLPGADNCCDQLGDSEQRKKQSSQADKRFSVNDKLKRALVPGEAQ